MSNNSQARILVVDDAPLIRGMLVQVLKKYGYVVDTAENGQQAIEYFMSHRPDLILMDADMPVLDGVQACSKIRELPEAKHLPIIIVTSFVEREWVDRAYVAGATDYVTKPVNWDVLRNRIHYILQAKHAEEALFDEKEKAEVTLASIGDGVITTDSDGKVEYLNAIASKLTGWTIEEAKGKQLSEVFSIIDETTQELIFFPIRHCLLEGKVVALPNDTLLIHRNTKQRFAIEDSAAPIRDRHGRIIGVVLVFHDVTENRKMTRKLYYDATHDPLTGLHNRHEFLYQLGCLLDGYRDQNSEHVLLYMDLDRFKIVNDTCGHEAGDQLLKNVALILQQRLDEYSSLSQATLARLGGDEFALLLKYCTVQQALEISDDLCNSIQKFKFFWRSGNEDKGIFTIGISIGLVSISAQTNNQKSVLAMADAACYAAKNAGRNRVHVYQEEDADEEVQWLSLITENLERPDGFSLFYQTITSLKSQQGYHYEILLCMRDYKGGLVQPGAFISTAERYNLVSTLDRWVVHNALAWLSQQPKHLENLFFMHINISNYSLAEPAFLDYLIEQIQHYKIPPHKLCFELAEVTVITNFTGALYFIKTLKKLGCCFAIDDFGSGMASFMYLKNLPIDFLKIDKTYINGVANDAIDQAMIKTINEIAHLINLQTIAECVENSQLFDKLKETNTDYAQGSWIGKPRELLKFQV